MTLPLILLQFIQEPVSRAAVPGPGAVGVEDTIINLVQWLKLFLETIGALIIGLGVIIASYYFFRRLFPPEGSNYNRIRLILSRYLALALEFQVGADILSTAIAPSWDQIGKLAAIAVIRTTLNYFLSREMKEERTAANIDLDKNTVSNPVKSKEM